MFGIQKTDQEIEINESFGFRVKIDMESYELFRNYRPSDANNGRNFNYETIEFYIEAELYSQKCKL